jgi:hypothetical protein
MANTSTKYGWTFIAEYDQDWFTEFESLMNEIDAEVYAISASTSGLTSDHGSLTGICWG